MIKNVFNTFSDFSDFITDSTSAPIFNSFFTFSGTSITNWRFQSKNYDSIYAQGYAGNPAGIDWFPGGDRESFGYNDCKIGYIETTTADGANFIQLSCESYDTTNPQNYGIWYFIWTDDFLIVLATDRQKVNSYFAVAKIICFNNDYYQTQEDYKTTSNLNLYLSFLLTGSVSYDTAVFSNDRQRIFNTTFSSNFIAQPLIAFSQSLPIYKIFRDINDQPLIRNTVYKIGDSKFYTLIGFLGIKIE